MCIAQVAPTICTLPLIIVSVFVTVWWIERNGQGAHRLVTLNRFCATIQSVWSHTNRVLPLHLFLSVSLHINRNFVDSMCNPLHQTRQKIVKIKTQIQTENAPMRSKQTNEKEKQEKIRKEPAWLAAHCNTAEKQRIQIFFRKKKKSTATTKPYRQTHTNTNEIRKKKSNFMIGIWLHAWNSPNAKLWK